MPLRAGSLDRRVTILRAPLADTGFGKAPGTPAAVAGLEDIAAQRLPLTAQERAAAGETQASLTVKFMVRYSTATAGIQASDLVLCEGRTYGIGSVEEYGRREGFVIRATARSEVPVT